MDCKGLYVYTNDTNGMQYVGKAGMLSNRVLTHIKKKGSKELAKAIEDVGVENFSIKLIPYPDVSDTKLSQLEREKILELGSLYPDGYNKHLPQLKHCISCQNQLEKDELKFKCKCMFRL